MRLLVPLLGLCMCHVLATPAEMKTSISANTNSVVPQKPEMYYVEPHQQPQHPNLIPVQIIQKPFFLPQQHTMLIIAQPTYVPQSLLYGGNPATMQQQLLNYFHSNPQAKYQFLYGEQQPHPSPQPYLTQTPYEVMPNFNNYQQYQAAPPSQFTYGNVPMNTNHYIQPMQLNQLAQIAQNTAQQQFGTPIRSVPPIITGFENFTPEQQIQIKAQLNAQLGTPLATTATLPSTTTQATQKPSSDYAQNHDKSIPSSTGFTPMTYKAQFAKG